MSYTITNREHEMGEQPFQESSAESFGEALAQATYFVNLAMLESGFDRWTLVDPTDSGCVAIITYVLNDGEGTEVDYIIEVREDA